MPKHIRCTRKQILALCEWCHVEPTTHRQTLRRKNQVATSPNQGTWIPMHPGSTNVHFSPPRIFRACGACFWTIFCLRKATQSGKFPALLAGSCPYKTLQKFRRFALDFPLKPLQYFPGLGLRRLELHDFENLVKPEGGGSSMPP